MRYRAVREIDHTTAGITDPGVIRAHSERVATEHDERVRAARAVQMPDPDPVDYGEGNVVLHFAVGDDLGVLPRDECEQLVAMGMAEKTK